MEKNKTAILGVGNPLRTDDGVGPEIIRILLEEKDIINADIIDCGINVFLLFNYLEKYKNIIIVDALNFDSDPGTIKLIDINESESFDFIDALSTHGFGLKEVLNMAKKMNISNKITVVGIQAKNISYGNEMSEEIKEKIPQIVDEIKKQMNS
ncbi:MAG: hydrogenase maturation protease [Spirochaetes bacterium]|nr:hydrogenase maturation protease [Spirochaetota bacterium]